jgi:hypothetical protein
MLSVGIGNLKPYAWTAARAFLAPCDKDQAGGLEGLFQQRQREGFAGLPLSNRAIIVAPTCEAFAKSRVGRVSLGRICPRGARAKQCDRASRGRGRRARQGNQRVEAVTSLAERRSAWRG